ncbi:ATP-grasp domain-containing protein [Bradyrhizobium sp. 182]|uniref:ATP-grasp domain-containing protein n=1 Tax=Bradyrhizobium sp. 182 TaxID=2782651 RepID=UPI001FFA7D0E|nr:ATP-grasp domain-containing protein [Bradyrhizobium sp. 182]MCK1526232.1 ATP-grasp domain-containing protein [Bradyrhizobium sp. 182]
MSISAAVFIESNTSGSGADFVLRARELGLFPVFITASPERYGFVRGSANIDLRICDTSSEAAVTAEVDSVAAERPIRLLTTSSDLYLYIAAFQAKRLGLAGPEPDVIALCRDKARQAAVLRAHGIVVPRSAVVRRHCDIGDAIARAGLPAVVKPVSGTGSNGVSLVRTTTEAIQAVRKLLETTTDLRGRPTPCGALLMSYVAGAEFSVEILDKHVLGVTRKHLGSLPHFVEIGHDVPAIISHQLRMKIVQSAVGALEVLGHTRGPAHVELRAERDRVTIIEVNPRLAGGSIPSLLRYVSGFDAVRAVLLSLLGKRAAGPTVGTHGSIRFIIPARDGQFYLPPDADGLVERFRLAEFTWYRTLPIDFRRCDDFRDRIGHVIAIDDNPDAAAHRADAAINFIRDAGG